MSKPNIPMPPKPPEAAEGKNAPSMEELQAKLEALESENKALKESAEKESEKKRLKDLKKAEGALAEIKRARGGGRYSHEEFEKIRAIKTPIKVKALAKGLIKNQRIKPGQVFVLPNGENFSRYWMELVQEKVKG